MKCRQIQELMGAYVYGDLAPDEMREVRLHTQECAACREDVTSRGQVVSSLSDAVPQLSDEDRLHIAWAVKGAVRNGRPAQAPLVARLAPALALAGAVLAGMAIGTLVVIRSEKPREAAQQAAVKPKTAVVKIVEEHGAPPKKDTGVASVKPETGQQIAPKKDDLLTADAIASILRRAAATALTSRKSPKKPAAAHDAPAPVLSTPEPKKPSPVEEGTKLPQPTDLNDAQTSPKEKPQ